MVFHVLRFGNSKNGGEDKKYSFVGYVHNAKEHCQADIFQREPEATERFVVVLS